MQCEKRQCSADLVEKVAVDEGPSRHLASRSLLIVRDLKLDWVSHRAERAGRRISLSPREFALLEDLMQTQGQVLTRSTILQHVWNLTPVKDTNLVDVHVNYLRRKIDDGHQEKLIRTV